MSKTISLSTKEYFVWIAIISMFFFPIVSPVAAVSGDGHHHTGYYNYGKDPNEDPWYPLMGVRSDIKAINHQVPYNLNDFLNGHASVMFSYYPNLYWVQTGYIVDWDGWWIFLEPHFKFYIEKKDQNGLSSNHFGSPVRDTTYNFLISNVEMDNTWHYEIREESTILYSGDITAGTGYGYGIDLQAFRETTDDDISIDGGHHSNLKYMFGYNYWLNWNRHDPLADSPYGLVETSDTEFYTSGGG